MHIFGKKKNFQSSELPSKNPGFKKKSKLEPNQAAGGKDIKEINKTENRKAVTSIKRASSLKKIKKIEKSLAKKKIRCRTKLAKVLVPTDSACIKKMSEQHYEQLYKHKFNNLDEIEQILRNKK